MGFMLMTVMNVTNSKLYEMQLLMDETGNTTLKILEFQKGN